MWIDVVGVKISGLKTIYTARYEIIINKIVITSLAMQASFTV